MCTSGSAYPSRRTSAFAPARFSRSDFRADLHQLSLFLHTLPFRVYDAATGDVTYGRRTSDSLPGLFQGDVEGHNGFQATFGYQILAGPALRGVTIMGGVGVVDSYHDIGGT